MVFRIQVADVRSIGWIPYYNLNTELISSYQHYCDQERGFRQKRKTLACKLLFFSGNEPPPPENIFAGQNEFIEFLSSKNYRGAISIHDIKLHCLEDGSYDLAFETLPINYCVGYTPYRVNDDTVIRYAPGDGWLLEPTVKCDLEGVSIEHTSTFRIGKFGRILARALTRYEPPYAWIKVRYYIRRTGVCTITLSGSSIPNQMHSTTDRHQNYCVQYYHDMEENNVHQISSMLETRELFAQECYRYQFDIVCEAT